MMTATPIKAEESILHASIDIEKIDGNLHIKPSVTWLLAISQKEAKHYSYHFSSIKREKGGSSQTNQKGSVPLKPLNKKVLLSKTQVNFVVGADYTFSLKIYNNGVLVETVLESL